MYVYFDDAVPTSIDKSMHCAAIDAYCDCENQLAVNIFKLEWAMPHPKPVIKREMHQYKNTLLIWLTCSKKYNVNVNMICPIKMNALLMITDL